MWDSCGDRLGSRTEWQLARAGSGFNRSSVSTCGGGNHGLVQCHVHVPCLVTVSARMILGTISFTVGWSSMPFNMWTSMHMHILPFAKPDGIDGTLFAGDLMRVEKYARTHTPNSKMSAISTSKRSVQLAKASHCMPCRKLLRSCGRQLVSPSYC